MNENKVENYKIIGPRQMDMNNDLKLIFYNNGRDPGYEIKKPYFNDAEETFRIYCSNVGEEFSSLYRFHSGSEI